MHGLELIKKRRGVEENHNDQKIGKLEGMNAWREERDGLKRLNIWKKGKKCRREDNV